MDVRLRHLLRANALFSITTGLLLLLLARHIATRLGFPHPWVLTIIGIGLALFAVDLFLLSRRPRIPRARSLAIVASDGAWVVGSSLLLALWPTLFNVAGRCAIAAIAVVVGTFAFLQFHAIDHQNGVFDESS